MTVLLSQICSHSCFIILKTYIWLTYLFSVWTIDVNTIKMYTTVSSVVCCCDSIMYFRIMVNVVPWHKSQVCKRSSHNSKDHQLINVLCHNHDNWSTNAGVFNWLIVVLCDLAVCVLNVMLHWPLHITTKCNHPTCFIIYMSLSGFILYLECEVILLTSIDMPAQVWYSAP